MGIIGQSLTWVTEAVGTHLLERDGAEKLLSNCKLKYPLCHLAVLRSITWNWFWRCLMPCSKKYNLKKIQGKISPFLQCQRSNLGGVGFLPPQNPWKKATQLLKRPWSPGTSLSESEIGKLHVSDQPWETRRPSEDSECPRTQNMSGDGILPLPAWGLQTLSKELYPHFQKKAND